MDSTDRTGKAPAREPAKRPCGSCPYRRDVPSGVWDASEYAKLPAYDNPTPEQPVGLFLCHQQDGRVCAGWVACHDMDENLALRLATITDSATGEVVEAIRDYETDVEIFENGDAAAEHGLRDLARPGNEAQHLIDKIKRKRDAATSPEVIPTTDLGKPAPASPGASPAARPAGRAGREAP